MSSIIRVGSIQNTDGSTATLADLGITEPPTAILRQDAAWCDGGTYNGITFPNVTGEHYPNTTAYTTINGSSITYTPPANTKYVEYELTLNMKDAGYGGISHYKFYVGGQEATVCRQTKTFSYESGNNQHGVHMLSLKAIIMITGSTDDIANGKLASWTTAKGMHWKMRNYDSGYKMRFHKNNWWDGGGAGGTTNDWVRPYLKITAVGY